MNVRKECSIGASQTEYVVVMPRHHDVNSRIQVIMTTSLVSGGDVFIRINNIL